MIIRPRMFMLDDSDTGRLTDPFCKRRICPTREHGASRDPMQQSGPPVTEVSTADGSRDPTIVTTLLVPPYSPSPLSGGAAASRTCPGPRTRPSQVSDAAKHGRTRGGPVIEATSMSVGLSAGAFLHTSRLWQRGVPHNLYILRMESRE